MWMARWGVFVNADDPVGAADNAFECRNDQSKQHWTVTNLDTGDTVVVDLANRRVVPPG